MPKLFRLYRIQIVIQFQNILWTDKTDSIICFHYRGTSKKTLSWSWIPILIGNSSNNRLRLHTGISFPNNWLKISHPVVGVPSWCLWNGISVLQFFQVSGTYLSILEYKVLIPFPKPSYDFFIIINYVDHFRFQSKRKQLLRLLTCYYYLWVGINCYSIFLHLRYRIKRILSVVYRCDKLCAEWHRTITLKRRKISRELLASDLPYHLWKQSRHMPVVNLTLPKVNTWAQFIPIVSILLKR